ncbi:TetR/AcrR family transcriptional regulator [Cupriavidus necator]|uniref:TetR/AcrR family transcriptional regulator n=1 Tax=Cupriavidus necator TaxID=106590 RepID=UPI003ECD3970
MTFESGNSPTPARPVRPQRLTRAERADALRNKILAAASAVVGQYGYAEASINRITEAAGIAQGTFYLYFESRQALFDVLLPHVGADMLAYIGESVAGAQSFIEVEERGFLAFFAFLRAHPGFFRVLNEAEVAAPTAHATHMELITTHYVRSLERALAAGEITEFAGEELEALAYMFQAARSYLYMRYVKGGNESKELPDWLVQTYMKLVRHGLKQP